MPAERQERTKNGFFGYNRCMPNTVTPFQQGKADFATKMSRFDNPYAREEGDARAEWEAGFDYGLRQSIVQPEHNQYASEVYAQLVATASSFRDYQLFSAADELEAMAARGPDQWRRLDQFSTADVMQAATQRLATLARLAEREGV